MLTKVNSVTIRWRSNENSVYQCAVDDITKAVNCGSGRQGTWRTPVMTDGEHIFYLVSKDTVENRGATLSRKLTVGE